MREREFLASVGVRVRVLRAMRGLTQRQVADAAGIHRTVVGKIERGEVNFGVNGLYRLAQALGTQAAQLVPPDADGREQADAAAHQVLCGYWYGRTVASNSGPDLPHELVCAMGDAPLDVAEAFLEALEAHAGKDTSPEQLWVWWRRVLAAGKPGGFRWTNAGGEDGHPTFGPKGDLVPPQATPAAVRAALLPEDVPVFDTEFREAMATATRTFDLTLVNDCMQRWRLVASSSAEPDAEREMRRQATRLRAGEDVPTIPLDELRRRL